MKKNSCFILLLNMLLLSGCWDSTELEESSMVLGIGVSKQDEEYQLVIEAIHPPEVKPSDAPGEGESIILETKAKTLPDAVREMTRVSKRRNLFTHTEVWIINSNLAKDENILEFLDLLRREDMMRLNSYLIITNEDPIDVFSSDPLFNEIITEGIVAGLEYKSYVSGYPEVRTKDFVKMLKTPLNNGYLPFIKIVEEKDKILREFEGTAIFKEMKMAGLLNSVETEGLLWLNDRYERGIISIEDGDISASYRVLNSDTDINLNWNSNYFDAEFQVHIEGDLAELKNLQVDSLNEWMKYFENKIEKQIENKMKATLQKLQNDLETDATPLGLRAYRSYPEQFNQVSKDWNDFFSEATIKVNVDAKVTRKGFINDSSEDSKKQKNKIPYPFIKE